LQPLAGLRIGIPVEYMHAGDHAGGMNALAGIGSLTSQFNQAAVEAAIDRASIGSVDGLDLLVGTSPAESA